MIAVSIKIEKLDELRDNFQRAPARTLKYLAQATKASLFEVEKQAIDSNFQFKTPRSLRTGQLSLSFAFGRKFENGGLRASIGPTVHYATYVYLGNRHQRPNPYMDRIAKAAEPAIQKHFDKAVDGILTQIAKT